MIPRYLIFLVFWTGWAGFNSEISAASRKGMLSRAQILQSLNFWINGKDFPGNQSHKACLEKSQATLWSELQAHFFCALPRELQACLHKNLYDFKLDGTNRGFLKAFSECERQSSKFRGVYYSKPFSKIPPKEQDHLKRILVKEPIPSYAEQRWILNQIFGGNRPKFADSVANRQSPSNPSSGWRAPFPTPSAPSPSPAVPEVPSPASPATPSGFPKLCEVIGRLVNVRSDPSISSTSIGVVSRAPVTIKAPKISRAGATHHWYPISLPNGTDSLDGYIASSLIKCE